MSQIKCPKCHSESFWQTKDGRLKCKNCRYLFKPKENQFNLPNSKLEQIVALFLLETPIEAICQEVQISKYKLLKIIEAIRKAMTNDVPEAFQKNKELVQKPEKIPYSPFIGLFHQNGSFFVNLLSEITKNEFLNFLKEKENLNQIEDWQRNFGLVYKKRLYRIFPSRFKERKIDEIDQFWAYLKKRVFTKAGIRKNKFYLHLGEYVWRYNHRNSSLEEMKTALMNLLSKL